MKLIQTQLERVKKSLRISVLPGHYNLSIKRKSSAPKGSEAMNTLQKTVPDAEKDGEKEVKNAHDLCADESVHKDKNQLRNNVRGTSL